MSQLASNPVVPRTVGERIYPVRGVRLTMEAFSSERQEQDTQKPTTLQAQGCADRSEGCSAQEPCAQGGTNAIQSESLRSSAATSC